MILTEAKRCHRYRFGAVLNDLEYFTRTRRGARNMRTDWVWAVWNRKYYDKDSISMELIPDVAVKRIARGVHDIPLWLPHHIDSFDRIAADVRCTLSPWMPKQSRYSNVTHSHTTDSLNSYVLVL